MTHWHKNMKAEKGKTARYLREKQGVPERVKEELKEFNRIKRAITGALEQEDLPSRSSRNGCRCPSTK